MKRLITIILLWLPLLVVSQNKLDCNGSIYRVIEKSADISTLQKLYIDPIQNELETEVLAIYKGHQLNAMSYRSANNSLYGLKLASPYQLFKIDENLELTIEKTLPLPESLNFVAGDIHPDGRHMIVLGYGIEEAGNILAIIDLADPNYHTELIPLVISGSSDMVICADIAFHPTTGILYGFDKVSNSLMSVDIEDGRVDLFTDQVYSDAIGIVPSLFFDHEGRLFGFSISDEYEGGNNLYEFDPDTGFATHVTRVRDYGSQDACSCPFKVQMQQTINNEYQYACTEARFVIKLINRTPLVQTGLSIIDTLPLGMTLKSVDYNPFASISNLSADSRIISFTDFDLPIGVDSIVYTVYIEEYISTGFYTNQSWLSQEFPDLRSNLVKPLASDNPRTSPIGDPTTFLIDNINDLNRVEESILCIGESILLRPNILGIQKIEWDGGELTDELKVTGPGTYDVTITGSCGKGVLRYNVESAFIDVTLPEDKLLDRDQKIDLIPDINSSSEITTIIWKEINGPKIIGCYTCPISSARFPIDMGVEITVKNTDGCVATDELYATVEEIRHYIPNAFSPNGDGHNDVFYLQSKKNYSFKDFSIFDRWGNRQFIQTQGMVNDEVFGWNGTGEGKALNPGIYIWHATIVGLDEEERTISGDVMLMR